MIPHKSPVIIVGRRIIMLPTALKLTSDELLPRLVSPTRTLAMEGKNPGARNATVGSGEEGNTLPTNTGPERLEMMCLNQPLLLVGFLESFLH